MTDNNRFNLSIYLTYQKEVGEMTVMCKKYIDRQY